MKPRCRSCTAAGIKCECRPDRTLQHIVSRVPNVTEPHLFIFIYHPCRRWLSPAPGPGRRMYTPAEFPASEGWMRAWIQLIHPYTAVQIPQLAVRVLPITLNYPDFSHRNAYITVNGQLYIHTYTDSPALGVEINDDPHSNTQLRTVMTARDLYWDEIRSGTRGAVLGACGRLANAQRKVSHIALAHPNDDELTCVLFPGAMAGATQVRLPKHKVANYAPQLVAEWDARNDHILSRSQINSVRPYVDALLRRAINNDNTARAAMQVGLVHDSNTANIQARNALKLIHKSFADLQQSIKSAQNHTPQFKNINSTSASDRQHNPKLKLPRTTFR